MRLSFRITAAVALAAAALFGGGGYILLQREQLDLLKVAQSEALLLARSLQTAFENALRDRQIEDVVETLGVLASVDPLVSVFVFDETGRLMGSSKSASASPDSLRVEKVARLRGETVIESVPRSSPRMLRIALRLRDEVPAPAASIVLEKPLNELQRDLAETRRSIVLTAIAVVAAVAGLTWALSRRYIARPLQQMILRMQQLRRGDLPIQAGSLPYDEVGDTQREFRLLVNDLRVARARADREFEARRRMERGLEHADKLITLGQLSAVMAHEIGSPLQVLEGRARALLKHSDDAEATRRTAVLLLEQTTRITGIVMQMLSITRRRPPLRVRVDAEVLVRRVADLLEVEARRREVALRVERLGPTFVYADGDQLQQVVLNLLRNALDAAPPGSVVEIAIGGDERELVIDVKDEGPGIAAAIRPHLCEPFFTTKAESGGSGLGLSVVKSILEGHGGHVRFLEISGPGCHVRVTLPRTLGENAA